MEIKMNPRQFVRYASIAALLMASNAQAQLFRAYLSGSGNDGNACTLQAPCRLLPAALSAVADGGEVWMLDSANYNTSTVSVGKSVSILAIPGAVGSVVALNGGPAVSITVPGLTVALRNVVIGPVASMAPGTNGVEISADSSLVIEGSLIVNLEGSGVVANGAADVRLVNTTVRNNGEWALRATDGVAGTVSKSQLVGNTLGGVRAEGLTGAAITNVSVTDSLISGGDTGVQATTQASGATARVVVTRSTIDRTGTAMVSDSNGSGAPSIVVSGSMVTENATGWNISGSGAAIRTLQNNQITDNGAGSGTLTTNALM